MSTKSAAAAQAAASASTEEAPRSGYGGNGRARAGGVRDGRTGDIKVPSRACRTAERAAGRRFRCEGLPFSPGAKDGTAGGAPLLECKITFLHRRKGELNIVVRCVRAFVLVLLAGAHNGIFVRLAKTSDQSSSRRPGDVRDRPRFCRLRR